MKPSSMQPIARSRLLPRISFRLMMFLTALAAGGSAIARAAGDGGVLAKAIVTIMLVLAIFFVASAMSYLLAWAVARIAVGRVDNSLKGNPFAKDQLPPQVIRPREPGV